MDLTHNYYTWLLLGVDHVIPQRQAPELGIPEDWYKHFTNLVMCCSGSNGIGNRYQVQAEPHQWTSQEFYELRDRAYREKYVLIAQRREKEMAFFDGHPWEEPEEVPPA